MKQAEHIRQFALDNYVAPARAEGHRMVAIRAGDVHREMGLTSAMPTVCSAIGGRKFRELAQVVSESRTGPLNGANVVFTFDLKSTPQTIDHPLPKKPLKPVSGQPTSARQTVDLDFRDALVLVSCVKSKLPHAAPARSVYTSAWFIKTRDLVERSRADWLILSARYGLVLPNAEIAPYEYTLNTIGIAERRAWAGKVLDQILPMLQGKDRVVIFAGQRYREFLVGPLQARGIQVDVPMAKLRQGEQLSWLSEQV